MCFYRSPNRRYMYASDECQETERFRGPFSCSASFVFICRGLPASRPRRSVEDTMPESSGLISISHGLDVVTLTTGAALIWTGVQFYLEPQSCTFTNPLSNVRSWWLMLLSR